MSADVGDCTHCMLLKGARKVGDAVRLSAHSWHHSIYQLTVLFMQSLTLLHIIFLVVLHTLCLTALHTLCFSTDLESATQLSQDLQRLLRRGSALLLQEVCSSKQLTLH